MTRSALRRSELTVSIVIPTVGRPSLSALVQALAPQLAPEVVDVIVVDDRAEQTATAALSAAVGEGVRVVGATGRGPAAARNVGWRLARGEWISFLDDDVEPPADWVRGLLADLRSLTADVGGSQGRIVVPLPEDRRPTDWERCTAGLEAAAWATADMAYRRDLLERLGGFDERFPRAFREDADLALRAMKAGTRLVRGSRTMRHPVRAASPWVSLKTQAGNADDALMRRLHGAGWYDAAQASKGRIGRHAAVVAAGVAAIAASAMGRKRMAAVCASAWAAGTAEFVVARTRPGPRTRRELATMAATSVAIPPLAVWHRMRGEWRWRGGAESWPQPVRAVLFDRDGTLVRDVPYNGDPTQVSPMPDARRALDRLRASGLAVGVISNQSGMARGLIDREQVAAVNARIEELLGPFDTWQICPHAPDSGCDCRKPAPGLVVRAGAALGVQPWECAVVGDIGSDVEAAVRAGARAVLVPTAVTRPQEVDAAPEVAANLLDAVESLLAWASPAAPSDAVDQRFEPDNVDRTPVDQPFPPDKVDQLRVGVGAGSVA